MSAQDELGLPALLNKWADVLTTPSGDFVNEDLRRAAAALTSLIAERDGLREALKPFAEVGQAARTDLPDSHPMMHVIDDWGLNLGHFRRARTALSLDSNKGDGPL